MPLKAIRLPIFCLLFVVKIKAQYTDTTVHMIGFTSTGTLNKTSTSRSYLLNNALKYGVRKKDVALNSANTFLYGDQDGRLTNKDFASVWDVNLYKTFPHFYYWGLFNYNINYSLKVNNQLLTGVGIAYRFVDKVNMQVSVSDGILYDYSDITKTDSTREIYGTPRNSLRLQLKWNYKNRFIFNGNGFLQNSLHDQNDYIVKSEINLIIKIKKWLSFTSSFTYNQMTRTKRENLFATYGLMIEKYF